MAEKLIPITEIGKARITIEETIHMDATNLPGGVTGKMSPYLYIVRKRRA